MRTVENVRISRFVLMVFATLAFLTPLPCLSQHSVYWKLVKAKPGMEQQLARAYKELDRSRQNCNPFYLISTITPKNGGPNFAVFASEESALECFSQSTASLASMISSTVTISAVDRYDIAISSAAGSRCVPGYQDQSAELVRYDLKPGQREAFIAVQKKIRDAWGDSAPPFSYCWEEIVGRRRSSFILVLPKNQWADSARLEKFFSSILVANLGREEAAQLMNVFESSVQRRNVTRWDYLAGHAVALTAAMGPSYGMPQFLLPPPRWTSRYVLPAGLVVKDQDETLGDAFDRITEAFRHAGIAEWSTYAIGEDGFAVVSRMEHIDDDGRPRPGSERWDTQSVTTSRKFTLTQYLKLLFSAQPGRYRVIVFLVTEKAITSSTTPATPDDLDRALAGGAGTLSPAMRKVVLRSSSKCEALVYEFYRPSEDDVPQSVDNSTLLTVDHLALAGFWNREELLH